MSKNNIKTFESYLGMYEEDAISSIPQEVSQQWLDKYHLYCQENNESPECLTVEELEGDQAMLDHVFYCADDYCRRNGEELVGRELMGEADSQDVNTGLAPHTDSEIANDEVLSPELSFDQWEELQAHIGEQEEEIDGEGDVSDSEETMDDFDHLLYNDTKEYEEVVGLDCGCEDEESCVHSSSEEEEIPTSCGCEDEESCTHVQSFETYGYSYEEEIDTDGVEDAGCPVCGSYEADDTLSECKDEYHTNDDNRADRTSKIALGEPEIVSGFPRLEAMVNDELSTKRDEISSKLSKINDIVDKMGDDSSDSSDETPTEASGSEDVTNNELDTVKLELESILIDIESIYKLIKK